MGGQKIGLAGNCRAARVGNQLDPVAALTTVLPDESDGGGLYTGGPVEPRSMPIAAPPTIAEPDHSPRDRALICAAVGAALVVAVLLLAPPNRRVRRLRPDEY